jgi:hypothetical protein
MTIEREKREVKEKDIAQIVRYLTSTFNQATSGMERAFRGKESGPNEAYVKQTMFAYALNDLIQGPKCMQQKYISDCNEIIDGIMIERAAREKAAQ